MRLPKYKATTQGKLLTVFARLSRLQVWRNQGRITSRLSSNRLHKITQFLSRWARNK